MPGQGPILYRKVCVIAQCLQIPSRIGTGICRVRLRRIRIDCEPEQLLYRIPGGIRKKEPVLPAGEFGIPIGIVVLYQIVLPRRNGNITEGVPEIHARGLSRSIFSVKVLNVPGLQSQSPVRVIGQQAGKGKVISLKLRGQLLFNFGNRTGFPGGVGSSRFRCGNLGNFQCAFLRPEPDNGKPLHYTQQQKIDCKQNSAKLPDRIFHNSISF